MSLRCFLLAYAVPQVQPALLVAFLPFVFIFGKPAANSDLEPREFRVHPHAIKERQKLSKDRKARLFQIVRMSSLPLDVAFHASDARLDDFVHQ